MKRTIILNAKDDEKQIKLICKINHQGFFGMSNNNDKMHEFTENFADKLFNLLNESFYGSAIKRLKP